MTSLIRRIKDAWWWLTHEPRWFIHRGRHGWAHGDCWDMYTYLARIIWPMLIELRDTGHGFWSPNLFNGDGCPSEDDAGNLAWWNNMLTEMAEAFRRIAEENPDYPDYEPANDPVVRKGLENFRTYFFQLWD